MITRVEYLDYCFWDAANNAGHLANAGAQLVQGGTQLSQGRPHRIRALVDVSMDVGATRITATLLSRVEQLLCTFDNCFGLVKQQNLHTFNIVLLTFRSYGIN